MCVNAISTDSHERWVDKNPLSEIGFLLIGNYELNLSFEKQASKLTIYISNQIYV